MEPLALVTGCAIFGAILGSFLNVVIHRLPIMLEREWATQCADLRGVPRPEFDKLTLAVPRSRCPKCGHIIENRDVYHYELGSWIKNVTCDRCDHTFIAKKNYKPSFGPLIGPPQPPEVDWSS